MTKYDAALPCSINSSRRITRTYGKKRTADHFELPSSGTSQHSTESTATPQCLVEGTTSLVSKEDVKVHANYNKSNLEWNTASSSGTAKEKNERIPNKRIRTATQKRQYDHAISMELLANTDYMIEMEDNKRLLQEDVIFSVKSVNSFTTVQHFVDEARLNERIITLPDRLCKSDRIKVEYILNKVNDALGAANLSMDTDRHHRYKIYLYLAATRKVVGCLVAESINTAFRVISVDTDNNNDNNNLDDSLIYKSNTPVTCLCGISRIWVDKTMRRQGVATRLLDAARRTFVYACTLDYDQIAFSQPTLLGRRLAMNYQKDANFLVYSENI